MNLILKRHSLILIIFLFFCCQSRAHYVLSHPPDSTVKLSVDTLSRVVVQKILILGNRKTKQYIIQREIHFKEGDSLLAYTLEDQLIKAQQQIYNTLLFNIVNVTSHSLNEHEVIIIVDVKERWYIYPTPQIQFVDRSFSEWLNKQHANFNRINYGIRFSHNNLTGRKDELRIYILNGFSHNYQIGYSQPYSNSKLTEGFSVSAGFIQNQELTYKTNYNNTPAKPFRSKAFAYTNINFRAAYQIRRAIKVKHQFIIAFNHFNLNDSIIQPAFNPHYFNQNKTIVNFTDITYNYSYNDLDNLAYPLSGISYFGTLSKRGLELTGGINMLSLETGISRFYPFEYKWYLTLSASGKIKLPFDQPYINLKAFSGDNVYLQGLEYYLIDGSAYSIGRASIKKCILDLKIPNPFKTKSIPYIPFRVYLKDYVNLGFCYALKKQETQLNNTLLYTTGIGLDVVSLYDTNVKVECSMNQFAQIGIFLHGQIGF